MSQITNALKRTRRKLELFNQEGFNEALFDFVAIATEDSEFLTLKEEDRTRLIEQLKSMYLQKIEVLKPDDFKQTKLEL